MNAIKRFINLLKSPLIPIRLFAVEDDFDFSEFEDSPSGYYDSEGNYLGDDAAAAEAAAASHDDPSLNSDNWSEYSDDFGNVSLQSDANGNYKGAQYRDPTTGEWKDSSLSGYQEAYGRPSEGQTKQAVEVFGASMTPETLAALNGANEMDVSTALGNAAEGDAASLAQAIAMTGTTPDADSLRGLGYTDDQIETATGFATDFANAIAEGKDPRTAWEETSTKYGDPYGTNGRDQMLKDSVINTITMFGGQLLGAAGKAATGGKVASLLDKANKANKLSKTAKYTSMAASSAKRGTKVTMQALELLDKADKAGTVISAASLAGQLGISVAEAKGLIDAYNDEKKRYGDSAEDEATRASTTKEPESTRTTSTPEPTSTRADTGTKSDPTFTNPFGGNDPDPTGWIPGGPLEGTPLAGVGLPGHESEPEPEQEGFSTESGDDTLEESTQDAPTGGEGSDTFTNTNDDTRKGWGLGEEDPNRANYDNDKWNRGMERVSTDVVSDAKLKNFITKTFKDDPVLIRTMKIIKNKH